MNNVHFIGIGGVGMSALAVLLKADGCEVSGCDVASSSRTKWLESLGIPVAIGHDASHLANANLVVATPAVHRDNPEFIAAGSRLQFRGDVLANLVSRHRDSIAVCGSHGKTTTSTFIAKLLLALGENVAWAIGGETGKFPVASAGRDKLENAVLVVEADESDGTLARYHAKTLVVTNCEYDHPDFFKTLESYFACFDVAKKNARDVIESEALAIDDLSLAIRDILATLPNHNQKNARAAIEVAIKRGHTIEAISRELATVVRDLPDRRFQFLHREPAVITDYAHHPTEMACAVAMARKICRGKLRVLFQPHRYSRTKALIKDFPKAFDGADEVVMCPTYAAFENPIEGGGVANIYRECRDAKIGAKLFLATSCRDAWRHAFFEMREDDVTLLLGAGDIIKLATNVENDMKNWNRELAMKSRISLANFSFFKTGGESVGGGERVAIGMGSNTWISDLTTNREYVKNNNPADVPGATLKIPWMIGIPGTIGGWVKMNAGAFGHSISELIAKVKIDGVWRSREECGFGYRLSAIDGLIEDVVFIATDFANEEESRLYRERRKTFPSRCCGSVFKNPPGDYAGRLLESVGAKDLSVGGAQVWSEHANVIYANEGATSSDILALVEILRERVRSRLGIFLETEINFS